MENQIIISESFGGNISRGQILSNNSALMLWIRTADLLDQKNDNTVFFSVQSNDYFLEAKIIEGKIHLTKNEDILVCDIRKICDLETLTKFVFITFGWFYDKLVIGFGDQEKNPFLLTKTVISSSVPFKLIEWARKELLIPTQEYDNLSTLKERIFSIFESVENKIQEVGNYEIFYNPKVFKGEKIWMPKREPQIKDIIQMLISDLIITSGFSLISEKKTGIGTVDFKISGKLKTENQCYSIAVECKKDKPLNKLKQGYFVQLPLYMKNDGDEVGIYLIFIFGDYKKEDIESIKLDISDKLLYSKEHPDDPIFKNIRIVMLDLRLRKTASKAS